MISTTTDEVLFHRTGDITVSTSVNTGNAITDMVASIVVTALSKEIIAGQRCNLYTFSDLPAGKYHSSFGQDGEKKAQPIYGELMQLCLASPTYAHWHNLSFPMPVTTPDKHLEMPAFKEHLNLRDKITRPQLASPSRHPLREEKPQAPQRESFFKRLFKRKK